MDLKTQRQLEYEEQCYSYSSRVFTECFKDFTKDEVADGIKLLTNSISTKLLPCSKNPDALKLKINDLEEVFTSKYSKSVETAFEKASNKISEQLRIPDNVLLKEDLPIKDGLRVDKNKTEQEVEDLKKRYKSLLCFKEKLLEEVEEADSTIFILEKKKVVDEKQLEFSVLPVKDYESLAYSNLDLV